MASMNYFDSNLVLFKWMTVCIDWIENVNRPIGLTFVLVFFPTKTMIHRVAIKFLSFSNYDDILIL